MMTKAAKELQITEATSFATQLLQQLIRIQSFSREEQEATQLFETLLNEWGYKVNRKGHNIWVKCHDFKEGRPTIMMNSHLDTVKPGAGWAYNPFEPVLEGDKLTGLGSNDAGGPLVSLLAAFLIAENLELPYNRLFVASAEEEISGKQGMEFVVPELGKVDAGIVGEPTQMEMATAEKGLMVLDAEVKGKSGHAARTGGVNAISEAMKEIEWFHTFEFPKISKKLGPVKMTVTQINAGTQHNVIPDSCQFVVDVRTNEYYQNKEALEVIQNHTKAEVKPRSLRMNSSGIADDHPLVKAARQCGVNCFGSPTSSDQAVITTFPTVKMGPGDSNRSHTTNEFIKISEIEQGIKGYLALLKALKW